MNSPTQPSLIPTIDRLRLLTLALESALIEGRFAEAEPLFVERDVCLDELESRPLSAQEKAALDPIALMDKRIVAMLTELRSNAAAELAQGVAARAATRSYAGVSDRASSFDAGS